MPLYKKPWYAQETEQLEAPLWAFLISVQVLVHIVTKEISATGSYNSNSKLSRNFSRLKHFHMR